MTLFRKGKRSSGCGCSGGKRKSVIKGGFIRSGSIYKFSKVLGRMSNK